jgi:O-methyltransferase domain/Dimerisation domain
MPKTGADRATLQCLLGTTRPEAGALRWVDYATEKYIMTTALEATDNDFERMMQMLTGFFQTQIVGAVATYSIADHLAMGPATAEQIATIEGTDSIATFRLLRACASLGLVACGDGLTFTATPLLGTLRTNVPGSLHSLAIAWSAPGHWLPWGRFLDAMRTSQPQTVPALGAAIWDYYAQQRKEGAAFTNAMHGFTSGVAQDVTRLVDTSTAKLAVDIGGASGTLVHRQSVRILENCRRAMRPGGRVIVIERLLGEMGEPGLAPLMDLNMMVMLPGRERSLSEYRALLKRAGFRLDKSSPIRSSTVVIEAVAA